MLPFPVFLNNSKLFTVNYKKVMMRRQIYFRLTIISLFMMLSPFIRGQKIEYIKIPGLEKILNNPDDKVFVINFWATWCPPCVSEIPGFANTAREYDTGKVRFVLVSLDFPSQVEKQLIPFLRKNKITLPVDVMMDVDYNAWIDKVDSGWQGEIPATLFFNNSKKTRYFHSGALTEPELKKYINELL